MNRVLSLSLACALSLSLLTACGGGSGSSGAGGGSSSGSGQAGSGAPSQSQPDASIPGVSAPDASDPDASEQAKVIVTLNKSDFTLTSAGASYKLKAAVTGGDAAEIVWGTSDPNVATVDGSGTVTAVAPGAATITASFPAVPYASVWPRAQCIVRCSWEEADAPAGGQVPSETPDDPAGVSAQELAVLYTNAINSCGNEMALYNPPLSDPNGDGALALEMLGLASADAKAFAISFSMMNVHAYCISAVMPEAGREQAVLDALNGYVSNKQREFEPYLADQYEIALNARVETLSDGTIVLVMCADQDAAFEAVKNAITAR